MDLLKFKRGDAKAPLVHLDNIDRLYRSDIEESINESEIVDNCKLSVVTETYKTEVVLTKNDTVSQIFEEKDRCSVLDFADYKEVGGLYLISETTQEEKLCQVSTLYPVLKSFKDTYYNYHYDRVNNGLYDDDSIIARNILFFKENYDTYKKADVIVTAAPNQAERGYIKGEDYKEALKSRCKRVLECAYLLGNSTVILGAFGCGAFGNNPLRVAVNFRQLLTREYRGVFKRVIFAIPTNSKKGAYNYFTFREVFHTKK